MSVDEAGDLRSRRALLRAVGRGAAAAGLGGGVLWLCARGRVSAESACPRGGACGGCDLLARCRLPEASKARGAERSRPA